MDATIYSQNRNIVFFIVYEIEKLTFHFPPNIKINLSQAIRTLRLKWRNGMP